MGIVAVTAGALIGAFIFAVPARAHDDSPVRSHSIHFGRQTTLGAATSIEQEYAKSRSDPDYRKTEKLHFARRSANEVGLYYDVASLDAIHLVPASGPIQASIVAPHSYRVNSVDITATDRGDLTAQVHGTEAGDTALAYPTGPGFDSFSLLGSGDYLVDIWDGAGNTVAEAISTWSKYKVTGESDPNKNYYAYQRKGSFTTQYILHDAGMRSYPQTGSFTNWVDWAPATGDHSYNCGSSINAGVDFGGITLGLTFTPCDTYNVAISGSQPGDMSTNVTGDTSANTDLAFSFIVGVNQASLTPVWYDYTKIGIWVVNQHWFCDLTSPTSDTNCWP